MTFKFRAVRACPPWKPYDRFHLKRRATRLQRRPFHPIWLRTYAIEHVLRAWNQRRRRQLGFRPLPQVLRLKR